MDTSSHVHNIRLAYAFNALSSLASSIVLGSFLSTYIYSLTNSNDAVGYVSAVAGCAMIVIAAPVGWLTDKWPRHWMLRASGLAGAAASAAMFVALQADSMPSLYTASAAYGVYGAMSGAPLNSILADNTGSNRTAVFILQYALSLGAGAGGPLIACVFFWRLGNEWTTPTLRAVMHAGNALKAAATVLLWFFASEPLHSTENDSKSVDEDAGGDKSERLLATALDDVDENILSSTADERGFTTTSLLHIGHDKIRGSVAGTGLADSSETPLVTEAQFEFSHAAGDNSGDKHLAADGTSPVVELEHTSTRNLGHQTLRLGCVTLTVRSIPYIIFASDMMIASVLLDAAGTVCLFGLSLPSPAYVAVPLYLLRTAAMNASYPTQRAIMMDVVPKKQRGRWNALENVTSFTWTGSAALGGWLVDRYDYTFTFRITAFIYVAGTALLLLLVPLTWGEHPGDHSASSHAASKEEGENEEDAAVHVAEAA